MTWEPTRETDVALARDVFGCKAVLCTNGVALCMCGDGRHSSGLVEDIGPGFYPLLDYATAPTWETTGQLLGALKNHSMRCVISISSDGSARVKVQRVIAYGEPGFTEGYAEGVSVENAVAEAVYQAFFGKIEQPKS